ncbi:IclR family transcriptional regulator [Alloiococcus sp. CFN-8]|uniref:IclR family transcriptional regulator n=1 Tax=Alloiococcus sp. CFN-8 TaxID=3416081 RepID=UPI003CF8E058
MERALDILDIMYQNGGKMTLTEISKSMNLHKSTVYRTLLTLTEKDFLEKDEQTGLYTLSSRVFMMGLVAASNFPIATIARPHLEYLSEKYDEKINLSLLNYNRNDNTQEKAKGDFVLVLQQYLNNTYSKTLITPKQCDASEVFQPAVYMCFMAYLENGADSQEFRENYIKLNKRYKNKSLEIDDVISKVQHVRVKGYAYEENDLRPGSLCIAAPVFNKDNLLVGVLSINGQKAKLNKFSIDKIIEEIKYTASTLTDIWSRNEL